VFVYQKNRFSRFGLIFRYFELTIGYFLTEKSTFLTKKLRKIVLFDYICTGPKFDALSKNLG